MSFAFGFLEYLQQRGLTVAAERMMPALQFIQMQIGWVEQAFVVGYALFQFGGGLAGQRWGARRTFIAIGVATVVCIIATVIAPLAFSGSSLFVALCAAQFLMGVAQAPMFPVSTGVFETWFPAPAWALVQGLQTMGLGLGAARAPPFVAALMTSIGWQQALLWTGLPAIPLVLLWAWYGRNTPREHWAVSEQELALQPDTSANQANTHLSLLDVLAILRDRNVLLLTFSYFPRWYVTYRLYLPRPGSDEGRPRGQSFPYHPDQMDHTARPGIREALESSRQGRQFLVTSKHDLPKQVIRFQSYPSPIR